MTRFTLDERLAGDAWRKARARVKKEAKKARPPRVVPTAPEQRKVAVVDKPFRAYIRRQACAVGPVGCLGAVECAHVRHGRPGQGNAGMQRKPGDQGNLVPLCRGHHRDGPDAQHRVNEKSWWEARRIDPHALSAALYAAFLRGDGP